MSFVQDRRLRIGLGVGAALVLGGLAWWLWPGDSGMVDPAAMDPSAVGEVSVAGTEEPVPQRQVELYFPGEDGRLHGLSRELPESPDPAVNIHRMMEALLEGPHGEFAASQDGAPAEESESAAATEADGEVVEELPLPPVVPIELANLNPADGLWPPLPADVDVGRTYILDDATAVVDLIVPEYAAPMSGARAEILMLYSLVNTVLLNTEEAERLVLLWNGQQRSTFAGHFDTTRPLTPKTGLIAR